MRLKLEGLRFRHDAAARPVLDGISCDLPAGSSTAIVGPSGSGKTTLLAVLGGLLTPQEGSARAIAADGGEHRIADVATWVLQTVNLLPERTVLDNVALGAYLDGLPQAAAHARGAELLELVGLRGLADRPARLLSGGEMQRVGIARALASTRPLLLADEPTGQLDAETTDAVSDALFAAARRTILLVTHDPRVARRCDRVLRLSSGRLTEDG